MITEEEKQEIVNLAIERMLLILPETIGNLITNHITMSKINKDFYGKHPEFKKHRDIVASVVESEESSNILNDYESILKNAVPTIKERILQVSNLNMDKVTKPNRKIDLGDI